LIYRGILTPCKTGAYLAGDDGSRLLDGERIWQGYLAHFSGKMVLARRLAQKDYETGKEIIIIWPEEKYEGPPFVELYFNERLVKYPASLLGHLAVNVNGEIFNFSHLLNENEVIRREEYLYRPALGEFAPNPETMRYGSSDPGRPYYDKFGRLFMRTIHVLRITGIDTARLSGMYHRELDAIHEVGTAGKSGEKYAGFSVFTRSCATIIRDGLGEYGYKGIQGIFPRDLFINASRYFLKNGKALGLDVSLNMLEQLKVPEADYSAMPPLLNPLNRIKAMLLPDPTVLR
jgi:hypothetical protein